MCTPETILGKLPLYERRKRLRRPWSILLVGTLCLIWPFLNYFYLARAINTLRGSRLHFGITLALQIFFIGFPFIVGIGLLRVKKWGWWLFLGYCAALIVHNAVILILNPVSHNLMALIQVVVGAAALVYFLRTDISAPFMKVYPRGWRFQKRHPVRLPVLINNEQYTTRDLNMQGLYYSDSRVDLKIGQEIPVVVTLPTEGLQLRGGVVRIDKDGAGVAFRGMDRQQRKKLKKFLR